MFGGYKYLSCFLWISVLLIDVESQMGIPCAFYQPMPCSNSSGGILSTLTGLFSSSSGSSSSSSGSSSGLTTAGLAIVGAAVLGGVAFSKGLKLGKMFNITPLKHYPKEPVYVVHEDPYVNVSPIHYNEELPQYRRNSNNVINLPKTPKPNTITNYIYNKFMTAKRGGALEHPPSKGHKRASKDHEVLSSHPNGGKHQHQHGQRRYTKEYRQIHSQLKGQSSLVKTILSFLSSANRSARKPHFL